MNVRYFTFLDFLKKEPIFKPIEEEEEELGPRFIVTMEAATEDEAGLTGGGEILFDMGMDDDLDPTGTDATGTDTT